MNTFECNCKFCGKALIRKRQSVDVKVHFCDLICKAEQQRLAKPVTREWLEEHYITKGLDTTMIAHMVNRDPKSVWNWLKDFGIPRRGRGHASTHKFPKGYQSFLGKRHTEETRKLQSEIAKAKGRVPYDPAVGSYMKGRKGKDTPAWKGGITPERQAVYSSKEWCEAVKTVWKRDNAVCQKCGRRKNADRSFPFDIHHIVSFENRELRTEPSNLVLLCETCHYWAHSKKNKMKEFIAMTPPPPPPAPRRPDRAQTLQPDRGRQ